MNREFSCGEWHLDVTFIHALIRRFSGQDAETAFAERKPFDAIATVEILGKEAFLSGMLSKSLPLTRKDRRDIETLLRAVGATVVVAERGGEVISIHPSKKEI